MTTETEKTKTVNDIASRKVFDSPELALNYLAEIGDYEGFGDLQHAVVGLLVDDEGNPILDENEALQLDPAVYDESMQVAVAIISEKDTGAKKLLPVGLVVYPTPAPEAVMASEEGTKWIAKLVEKESNLIAMRALRKDGADFAEAAKAMPTTLSAYITPTREAATGILASFEALWKDIKKLVGQKSRAWSIANFSKKELRRAMESASYAAGTYPRIEKKGGDSSLLVFALNLGKLLASKHVDEEGNPAPLDPAFFDNALANRDSHAGFKLDEDDDLDLDDILAEADADANESDEEQAEEATDEAAE